MSSAEQSRMLSHNYQAPCSFYLSFTFLIVYNINNAFTNVKGENLAVPPYLTDNFLYLLSSLTETLREILPAASAF